MTTTNKTTTVKTSDLTGAALDWAVAKCLGVHAEAFRLFYEPSEPTDYDSHGYPEFHYSTVWSQGGPIIERERIDVFSIANGKGWCAQSDARVFNGYGPTPLVAALRCYVASKLGDEVEIPTDLANSNN